jgi:transposase
MKDHRKLPRRRHSKELKEQVLAECAQPGASVAGVALAHGINANDVRKWRRQASGALQAAPTPSFVTSAARVGNRTGHPHRAAAWRHAHGGHLAGGRSAGMRRLDARAAEVIRVDAVWLAVEPLDMRADTEAALPRGGVFGSARPHHAYLFANRRANRLKVLVHDGIGVWLAARHLNQGRFVWTSDGDPSVTLTREQFDALVLGLPWQRIREAGVISVL